MTWCISEPSPELLHAVAVMNEVGQLVAADELQAARDAIDGIDQGPLRYRWTTKSDLRICKGFPRFKPGHVLIKEPMPKLRAQREVYRRDG